MPREESARAARGDVSSHESPTPETPVHASLVKEGPRNEGPAHEGPAPPAAGADDPFAVVKRFAFTGLQLQGMSRLQERAVQQSLGLTEGQIAAFAVYREEVERLRKEFQNIPAATWEQTIDAVYVPVAERYRAVIERTLTPEQQFELLKQVVRRQRGAIALLAPGVPEYLELTPQQVTAICQIVDRNRRTANLEGVAHNPLEIARLMRVMSQARAEAERHLSAAQLQKWHALLGQ